MLYRPLNCIYFILYILRVNSSRYSDLASLRIMILENSTGGYQFEYYMSESITIPCTVRSPVRLEASWITWIFQPFKNLRYGDTESTEGAENLTNRSVFETINENGTRGTSTLYWEASKSGILWCMYNSQFHWTPEITQFFKLSVEIYIFSWPSADLAIKVTKGKTVRFMCESDGPYATEASLHWYFKPSTMSISDTGDGQDLTQFTEALPVPFKFNAPSKKVLKLTYKAETSGVLECRLQIPGKPADSSYYNLEVMTNVQPVCDECGDCEDVPTDKVNFTTHTEL